ncbi:MAG TPA: hypothetical protein VN615_10380 [Gaiellales bacterium]|nr:hypothetical protein [Gaiellales bacterium]
MSTIAAPRPATPPPVSYLNALWAVIQSMLLGLIVLIVTGIALMFVGVAAGLPLGIPGSSWTPLASVPDLFAWPLDPSLLWFRLVDLLALVTVVLWLGRRLRDRFLAIDLSLRLADTVLAVAGLIAITAISHEAGAVALFVVAGLLRRADTGTSIAAAGEGRGYGRWMAAVWAVALLGSLMAVNLVPVGEQAGASCSVSGGSVQPAPGATLGDRAGAVAYAFRHDGTFTACAMTQNRAWFTDATVQGIDAGQLPAAPWRVTLVTDAAPGFRPISPVRLTPRSTHMMFVLVRFTSCRPAMSGRTFTLSTLPLRVHAYGRTQTDPVPLSQPVRTSCP